jgi:N-acetylglutamate synthase-like GNAT family acetyltransferase
MTSLISTKLAVGDVAELAAALSFSGLPADDVDEAGRAFFRFDEAPGRVIGFGGFEARGTDALLRSIVVLPGMRGQGRGREIVARLLDGARAAGASRAYLLTTSAQAFFAPLGFTVVTRDDVPASILQTRQAAGLCRASATIMCKALEQ